MVCDHGPLYVRTPLSARMNGPVLRCAFLQLPCDQEEHCVRRVTVMPRYGFVVVVRRNIQPDDFVSSSKDQNQGGS